MRKYMTKQQALSMFKEEVLPYMEYKDTIAKREAWNNFTDMLCKYGEISDKQYNNWSNPF